MVLSLGGTPHPKPVGGEDYQGHQACGRVFLRKDGPQEDGNHRDCNDHLSYVQHFLHHLMDIGSLLGTIY